ncbi:hypothetical protein KAR91_88035 [Candidatus Pacearchaeota archaeon]|nr:hypothetical protein [Candidatus Pacearchaeota archaeon]
MITRRRFLRTKTNRAVEARVETRDCIIWDVLPAQKICRCKIQGSNELVIAYYPENWQSTPVWLKPGNAVILRHTFGNRNRLEVAGNGQMVPTPVEGDAAPAIETGPDAVLSGCQLYEITDNRQMAVFVYTGVIRIAGEEYILDSISMDESTLFDMSMGGLIDRIAEVVAFDAAPSAGQFRYDMIVVGSDLVLDYVKGTSASSDPVMPTVPAGHVKCGHVLIIGGMTQIAQVDINRLWAAPIPSALTFTIADDDLLWTELTTTITITVVDQDGNAILQSGLGWQIELTFDEGNGTISWDGNSSTTSLIAYTGDDSNEVIFTYTRDQLDPGDVSPRLIATMDGGILNQGYIKLRDISGDIMT